MAFLISEEQIKEWANSINIEYIDRFYDESKNHTYVKIICHKHDYKGIQILDIDRLRRWSQNGKCMCDLGNRDTEDLRRDPGLNPNVEIIGEYVKSNIKIKCKCRTCRNEWEATPNKLQQGRGCPVCADKTIADKNKYPRDKVAQMIKEKQPNLELVGEYKNMRTKVHFKCTTCGYEGYSYPSHLIDLTASCTRCNGTVGERKVAEWLDNNNHKYIMQYAFPDCKDVRPLRFDFYLPDMNICIEYQGEQHYMPIKFRKKDYDTINEKFGMQKHRDDIKREYCLNNHIKLIEVPYWELNHINEYLNKYLI